MSDSPSDASPPPSRPRFSWPMRLFLGFVLFDMVFHSFVVLWPYKEWCEEYGVAKMPRALPDPEQREELARASAEADHNLLTERVMSSFNSLWEYWKPWPGPETRKKMYGLADAGQFAAAWTATRLDFLEHLVRVQQVWSMFSPNVATGHEVARARLVYADGSAETIRTIGEPADPLHYESFRFLSEKPLQYSSRLQRDDEARRGFCNLLSHRRARNGDGSPLKTIFLISVSYNYPEPGKDPEEARALLAAQNVPLGEEKNPPFYEYDVATRKGRKIQQSEHK